MLNEKIVSVNKSFLTTAVLLLTLLLLPSIGTANPDLPDDLKSVSLETLLNFDLVVTLPGRKEQKLSDTASSIFVLSNEDIKRSGATHVAEALRLVPGVQVARISSNKWAISIRGFNQVFANKLLVLIDGVSVFSPTTNGVYWESNELDLNDIERIEVVRGPGGALWGSNAVNGVINIITKSSHDTQGTLVSIGGGTHERGFISARYGGQFSDSSSYRVYAKANKREENRLLSTGEDANDDWDSYVAGYRSDLKIGQKDQLAFNIEGGYQSDFFSPTPPSFDPPYVDVTTYAGDSSYRNFRSFLKWEHVNSATSRLETNVNFTRKERETSAVSFRYNIASIDTQHQIRINDKNELVYGLGYRYFENTTDDSPIQEVDPSARQTNLFSGFFQDEISLIPSQLTLFLGTKFEHNDLTGFELMPNTRILWNASDKIALWAAVSKATATPAIYFEDSNIPVAAFPIEGSELPGLVTIFGNRDLESETLLAYEAGLRASPTNRVSIDIATFYNNYDDIFSTEPSDPFPTFSPLGNRPALSIPLVFSNKLSGTSYGGEFATEFKASENWRLKFGYSYLRLDIEQGHSLDTTTPEALEDGSPQNEFSIRSLFQLTEDWQLDSGFRYVDSVPASNVNEYYNLDVRLGWKITPQIELSLVGQNLWQSAKQEGAGSLFGPPQIEIERGIYGKIDIEF